MKARNLVLSLALMGGFLCLQAVAAPQGPQEPQEKGYSHVRVVRLSFVDGTVMVQRPGSTEWTEGRVNTPVEEGFAVKTGENSFAEVEFENGSTARLGQLSEINFTELTLGPDGSKINRINFDYGYGTFNFSPTKHEHDVYEVKAGAAAMTPDGKAEFRTDYKDGSLHVEVFSGSVNTTLPGQKLAKLTKGRTLTSPTEEAYNISSGIEKDDWDHWVHARDVQTELAYNDSPVGLQEPLDGWADLNEYGAWGFFPGFGYAWSPFVAAGWAPFSDGLWSYYPSFGYTWISNEPWGWLPFHYGTWAYSPSFGYLWQPGQFGTFYPGLVTWFQGPGYVGWAPVGRGGLPACNPGAAGCVIAVKPGTLQGGGVVNPGSRVPVDPRQLTRTTAPLVPPIAAPLAGTARIANSFAARTAPAPVVAGSPRGVMAHPAPRIVLMGQNPAQATRMETRDDRRESFMTRAFGGSSSAQPARVRLGDTIGGRYNVREMGTMHSNAPFAVRQNAGFSRSSPVFLQGRASPEYGGARYQMNRQGAIRMQSSGGMRAAAPSSEGGFHGGGMSGGEIHASAPMSASHAASSGGGPHR